MSLLSLSLIRFATFVAPIWNMGVELMADYC